MSDYTPSGLPEDNTRGISKQIRDELVLVQTAINSKSDAHGTTSVSTTSMSITSPATKNFTIESGKELVPGDLVFIADTAAPGTNNMTGTIITYDADTGAISVSVTSHNGSGTKTAWTIGLSNQSGVTLISNTFTGHQNFARATVASHATTADIWNALGNQIDWTGVATTTAFPAAPQAGVSRKLICAAACSFTAGANLLIDGVGSGSTVTCAANDSVIVEAITTTQFKLTRQRYDGFPQKSSLVYLATYTASNSATVDIEGYFDDTYDKYLIEADDITVQTTGALQMRFKIGGSYIATATYASSAFAGGASAANNNVFDSITNVAGVNAQFTMKVQNPEKTNINHNVTIHGSAGNGTIAAGSDALLSQRSVRNNTTGALTGIRFLMASGNILTGSFKLYGMYK